MDNSLILNERIEKRIFEIGSSIVEVAKQYKESTFDDKVFETCMKNPHTKKQLLRFIEVLPALLKKDEDVVSHFKEYIIDESVDLGFMNLGLSAGNLASKVSPSFFANKIKNFAERMAKNFIAGANIDEASEFVGEQIEQGMEFSLDHLGEKTTSEVDANNYMGIYFKTLEVLTKKFGKNKKDKYGKSLINLSIKVSSLYSRFDPIDPENTSKEVRNKLRPIFKKAKEIGAFINIDTEHYEIKDITYRIFKELLEEKEFENYTDVGIVVQAYLKDSESSLKDLVDWAKRNNHPITIRLVKGAYWDHEVMLAQKNNWEIPVFTKKWQSDANYEKLTRVLLENSEYTHVAIASHNIRSIANALALKEELNVKEDYFEVQMLYGMGKEIKKALVEKKIPLRVYTPFGDLISGMGYFVRRLLENSSNESFIRSFDSNVNLEVLLRNPLDLEKVKHDEKKESSEKKNSFWKRLVSFKKESLQEEIKRENKNEELKFKNIPVFDFSKEGNRKKMLEALEKVSSQFGKINYGLKIGTEWVNTDEYFESRNPSKKSELIGKVSKGNQEYVQTAIKKAKEASKIWKLVPPEKRAQYLFDAAKQMEARIYTLSALLVFEAGKNWKEAYADIMEAIDFLNFYGSEMIRLGEEKFTQEVLGEENTLEYIPKGVVGVISPWNFPSAILLGMTSAAIVTGNTVVVKPASDTLLIAAEIVKIFEKVGLPPGVLNYVPGEGSVVGNALVESKDVNMIAFTGSRDVGLGINKKLAEVKNNQNHIKTAILELGGKDGIIIDNTANMDEEAIPGVIYSAFGYQGQKCSACSRVIVLESVYESFINKLIESAKSLKVGDTREPNCDVGPIINKNAYETILDYIKKGEEERGRILLKGKIDDSEGYYIGPTIIEVDRNNVIAREEIFGPVLSVIRVKDFDEAMEVFNETDYALTGGIYSRTPSHVKRFMEEALVGNRYVNRGITGAVVERQPFGGFKMSGVGSKAGGKDYLLNFMYPISNSVNTARSGHIPGIEDFIKNQKETFNN
ncbi:MAG: proline dehydrogenase family protein [Nanoarchaeota archaeon]|nr:proline dehydrogenase family protein [Nanoarchaeota archaeon]